MTLASILGGSALLLAAQTGAPRQQPPTFRSSVEAVQVTVIVTDAEGRPVQGLTEADFEILENGFPRPITTFAPVDIPIERTDFTAAAPDVLNNEGPPGRTYVIVLDDMRPPQARQARDLLGRFLKTYFGPNDLGAVVATTYGGASSDTGQEFTNNPRRLLDAIDRFAASPLIDGCEVFDPDEVRGCREKQVMKGLRLLAESLAKTPGRKAIIFVSPKGLGDMRPTEACGCNAAKLVDYKPGGLGDLILDMNEDYHRALSAATRGNVAFYPIWPGGTTADPSLKALAEFTGGFTPNVSGRSLAGFEQMVRENSVHYVLGFNSGDEYHDGRYVRIEVRVKRAGLRVRTLDGYVAPRRAPEPEKRPPGLLPAVWDAVASPLATSGVPMRMYAAPFKGNGKKATVAITLEIAATELNLLEDNGTHRGELEIAFAMTDRRNKRWPLWHHRASVALKPETYERVSRTALRVLSQLELPEGHYQLRASSGGAVLAGSVVYDLDVPDFRDDFAMSGVAITSAQASETFTVSPQAALAVAFPAPPTTAREFSRADTLTVFVESYENRRKPHTVTMTLEIRNEAGRVIGSDAFERTADKPRQTSVYRFTPRVVLERLPPGRYTIHVVARSSLDAHDKGLSRQVPITVRERG